jgi:hypothetical protein
MDPIPVAKILTRSAMKAAYNFYNDYNSRYDSNSGNISNSNSNKDTTPISNSTTNDLPSYEQAVNSTSKSKSKVKRAPDSSYSDQTNNSSSEQQQQQHQPSSKRKCYDTDMRRHGVYYPNVQIASTKQQQQPQKQQQQQQQRRQQKWGYISHGERKVYWRQNISRNVNIRTGYSGGHLVLRIASGNEVDWKCTKLRQVQVEQQQQQQDSEEERGELIIEESDSEREDVGYVVVDGVQSEEGIVKNSTQNCVREDPRNGSATYSFVTLNYDQFKKLKEWYKPISDKLVETSDNVLNYFTLSDNPSESICYDRGDEFPHENSVKNKVQLTCSSVATFEQLINTRNAPCNYVGRVVLTKDEFKLLGQHLTHIEEQFSIFPRNQTDDLIAPMIYDVVGEILMNLVRQKFPNLTQADLLLLNSPEIRIAFFDAYEHIINFSYSNNIIYRVKERLLEEHNCCVGFDLYSYYHYTISRLSSVILATASALERYLAERETCNN